MTAGPDDHLSRVSTLWTQIVEAHHAGSEVARAAQSAVIERYFGVVYRYLLSILRNQDAADEVFQEFALNFVRGGFRHADPNKGRFRDYVKVSVLRLVSKYRRKMIGAELPLEDERNLPEPGLPRFDDKFEETFLASCRDEFLSRTWAALRQAEPNGQMLFAVLDCRARHPDITSDAMAAELTARLNLDPALKPAGLRKMLQRARLKFSDLLLTEVAQTLVDSTPEELEQEIIDLGLHAYCRQALQRRKEWQNGTSFW